jgi:hypothetical protein
VKEQRRAWLGHNELVTDEGDALLARSTDARERGDPDLARDLLLEWAKARPHDRRTLLTLRTRLGRLGYVAEAVEAQREVVAITTERRRLADELITLAGLHREAGDAATARRVLAEGAALVPVDERGAALADRITREYTLLDDAKRPGTARIPGRDER